MGKSKFTEKFTKIDWRHVIYRIISWLMYTVLISLIPQGIKKYVGMFMYTSALSSDRVSNLLEILIIAIVISANTLKDIFEGDLYMRKRLYSFVIIFVCLFTIAAPSLMYGIVLSSDKIYFGDAFVLANFSALLSFFVGLHVRILASLKDKTLQGEIPVLPAGSN